MPTLLPSYSSTELELLLHGSTETARLMPATDEHSVRPGWRCDHAVRVEVLPRQNLCLGCVDRISEEPALVQISRPTLKLARHASAERARTVAKIAPRGLEPRRTRKNQKPIRTARAAVRSCPDP
jgi:hypothetical protein